MSIDKVQDNQTTYVQGKPVLIDTKSTQKSSGEIKVFDETTKTSHLRSGGKEVVVFPSEVKAINENGDITIDSQNLTEEQIENLEKLRNAKEFMKTDEGKKLAESMLNQQTDISSGQKKWLKKQGIDPDAFVQEWNRQNPDSPNNKKFQKQEAEDARGTMAAYAKGFLGNQRVKSNTPDDQDPQKGLNGLFKREEKETVKKDTTYSERGMKIKHHSSTDDSRQSKISDDVTDEIARSGSDLLDAFKNNKEGKRRVKFSEIDDNGNTVKYNVSYRKDGSVKKVVINSDEAGKLKVKREKDGDITIKGDLQADYAYEDSPDIETIETHRNQKFKETTTITNDNTYLRVDTKTNTITKVIKEDCPEPDISFIELRGKMVSDLPRQGKDFKQGYAQDGPTVLAQAEKMGMENLVKGYCGNPYDERYEASTESGNLNQLNARFITGCFINAELTTEKGPFGREINGMKADYKKLNEFIKEAYHRDQNIIRDAGPNADNQILKFIALEINNHNKAIDQRNGRQLPSTNNEKIDKNQLPELIRPYIK